MCEKNKCEAVLNFNLKCRFYSIGSIEVSPKSILKTLFRRLGPYQQDREQQDPEQSKAPSTLLP